MEVFFEATQRNDLPSIQTYLLYPQISKNINHQTPQDGFSALLWAAYHGHESVVSILLDHDANIDIVDKGNFAPLHYAAIANHVNVVELLLKRGAKVDIANDAGRTPLHWVSFYMREDVLRILLEWGADASLQDKHGFVPLQLVPPSQRRRYTRIFQEYEEKAKVTSKPNKLGEKKKDTTASSIYVLKDEEDAEEEQEDVNAAATSLKRKRFSEESQGGNHGDVKVKITVRSSTNAAGETSEATSPCDPQPPSKHSSKENSPRALTMKNRIMTLASMLRIRLPQMNQEEAEFPRVNYLQHFHNDHLISFDDGESDDDRYEHHVRTLEKKLRTRTRMRSMKERIEWLEEELGVS